MEYCKLEVLSDEKTLYPNMIETINASEKLVADGFKVLAYVMMTQFCVKF